MNTFLSGIKKLAVMLIAAAMLLGVVPVGMLYRPTTAHAEGEFLRLSPSAETFVSAKLGERDLKGREISSNLNYAGGQYDTYMRFDLSGLADKNIDEIHSASLRLAAVSGGTESADTLRLWLMQDGNWNENITFKTRPSALGELKLADISAVSVRSTGTVVEVNLTEQVKRSLKNNNYDFSLHMDSLGSGTAAAFAAASYEDSAFRPCLKILSGNAVDTDSPDLTKAWLEDYTAADTANGTVSIEDGKDLYLKFRFNRDNIIGAMYDIRLKASLLSCSDDARLAVSIPKTDSGNPSEALQSAEEIMAASSSVTPSASVFSIDITNAVNDVYAKGGDSLVLRLSAESGTATVKTPSLEIRAADNAKMAAAIEAGSCALGENPSPGRITKNLLNLYTAADGTKAFLKWSAYDTETGKRLYNILDSDGKITRPKWFEGSVQIRAKAIIASGAYRRERSYLLTILPEDAPDYTGFTFESYTDLGNKQSEDDNRAEFLNANARSKWIDGESLTCRTLEENGSMVLNLAVKPGTQNYLTLKLLKSEVPFSPLTVSCMQDTAAEPVILSCPQNSAGSDGFIYLTSPLPTAFTENREYISLRLSAQSGSDLNASNPSIYGAYIGDTSYFDPQSYNAQNELTDKKSSPTESMFYQFLKNLYDTTQRIIPVFGDAKNSTAAAGKPSYTWVDGTDSSVLAFTCGKDKIALSLSREDGTVSIFRNSLYYDAYSLAAAETENSIDDIEYGAFRIIRNRSESDIAAPNNLSGIYRDLITDKYYSFIENGETANIAALPKNTEINDGAEMSIISGGTLLLELVAESAPCSDYRMGKVKSTAAADLTLRKPYTELPRDFMISHIELPM